MNGFNRINSALRVLSLAMGVALAPAWASEASPELGLIKVADVIDVSHRLGDDGLDRVALNYSGASFLRVHLIADALPGDAQVVLQGNDGQLQQIDAADILEGGAQGFYALTMDTDSVSARVTDADGNEMKTGYALRIDKVDVGHPDANDMMSTPFSVIGGDQRQPAVCYQTSNPAAYRRAQAVARTYANGSLGTAWRVSSENRMLTNHHVMRNGANAGDYELWFGYEHESCSGGATKPGVKVRGGRTLVGDPGLDFQLFTVRDSDFESIRGFGHLGLEVGNLVPGEVIYMPQHGGGKPKQLAIITDDNSNCRITETPSLRGKYNCDTEGGSSGSPVIKADTGQVVVLHNIGGGSYNMGYSINAIWPKIQPHFADGAVPQTSP